MFVAFTSARGILRMSESFFDVTQMSSGPCGIEVKYPVSVKMRSSSLRYRLDLSEGWQFLLLRKKSRGEGGGHCVSYFVKISILYYYNIKLDL